MSISKIENITSKAITDLPKLRHFQLSSVALKEIPENMISMCDALETIRIENAEIESFSSRAFFLSVQSDHGHTE